MGGLDWVFVNQMLSEWSYNHLNPFYQSMVGRPARPVITWSLLKNVYSQPTSRPQSETKTRRPSGDSIWTIKWEKHWAKSPWGHSTKCRAYWMVIFLQIVKKSWASTLPLGSNLIYFFSLSFQILSFFFFFFANWINFPQVSSDILPVCVKIVSP